MQIFLTEYPVFNYPKGMEGWRFYRIEYGGFNEYSLAETTIWLPAHVDPEELERLLREWSEEDGDMQEM